MKRTTAPEEPVPGAQVPRPESGANVVKKTTDEMMHEIEPAICKVTCTTRPSIGRKVLAQVAKARIWPSIEDPNDAIVRGFATMEEMAPQSPIEARLVVQLAAVNDAALMFLNRSVTDGQAIEVVDANVGHATRLMRLFLQQIEAIQKLRGKPAQVNVDQVHVHQGGQAIVGCVNTSPDGDKLP